MNPDINCEPIFVSQIKVVYSLSHLQVFYHQNIFNMKMTCIYVFFNFNDGWGCAEQQSTVGQFFNKKKRF